MRACGCKAPVRLGVVSVAPVKPGRDLAFERGPIGDAAVQALAGKDGQFRFRLLSQLPCLGV